MSHNVVESQEDIGKRDRTSPKLPQKIIVKAIHVS